MSTDTPHKKLQLAVAGLLGLAVMGSALAAAGDVASAAEKAKPGGWASIAGVNTSGVAALPTTGGAAAVAADIYTVTSRTQFLAAVAAGSSRPKIIRVVGTLDMTEGTPFSSASDQKTRGELKLKSNTTVIGIGSNAKLINGWLMMRNIDNVIVRNLTIENPCDVAPKWDSGDGPTGNWNSEWDGATVDGANHVWLDHLTFTDGSLTDDKLPIANGHIKQCHDGALDIKNASDYVTVSNTVFELHQKNNLIGQSDSNDKDEGHQTITFNNNLFRDIGQRAPRVRYAMLHSYNNLFVGSKAHPVYPHIYSVGAGYKAKIISENNAFNIAGASSCGQVMGNPNASAVAGAIKESGSTINGVAVDITQCQDLSTLPVTWSVPYSYSLLSAAQTVKSVTVNAGAGRMDPAATVSK
jgi:pectate lyase